MNKLFIFWFLCLFSCNTRQLNILNHTQTSLEAKDLIQRVNSKNTYYEWINLKGKINFVSGDTDIILNISIKSKRDSLIWFSLSAPFGIELLRGQITPDSLCFVNRTNKKWFLDSSENIKKRFKKNIFFNEIQQIITANPIINENIFQLTTKENSYIISSIDANYIISKKNYRIIKAKLNDYDSHLIYSFSDFDSETNFPKSFYVKAIALSPFEAKLNYSKIEFNKVQKTPFRIPKSYEKIN